MNKKLLKKMNLFLIVICCLFIFIPKAVIASTNVVEIEHKSNVPVYKVWKIKFNKPIKEDNLSKSVVVYNPIGIITPVKVKYDSINNTIIVEPPVSGYICGQTYCLQISEKITDSNSNPLKENIIMNFTIEVPDNGPLTNTVNKKYVYKPYNKTLDEIVDMESKVKPVNVVANYSLNPSDKDIYEYLNPKNFEEHDYAIYQFLILNYIEGITAEDVDSILKGKGILEGQGKTIVDACEKYDVNIAYIIAHAILETGNGKSPLSNGIDVKEVGGKPVVCKKAYNMFGIGAWDQDPVKLGSERAYKEGWFTVEAAIEGGIKFISTDYINNSNGEQNTLYKMRWDIDGLATHQYATDMAWAYKQSYNIKEILDKCKNAQLVFEIPQYK